MFVFLFLPLVVNSNFLGKVSNIEKDVLQVFLFPHSHDDVGWVKTIDEYYTMRNGVKQIIDSYMEQLILNQTKRFSQVEIAFFQRWWNAQNKTMQDYVQKLVSNGQLEFLNGGWCMNDEATAYYEDIIDQMTIGHLFILDTFGYIPSIGWQVDPFGHSSAQAKLFSKMGFNAYFIGRIDEQDKKLREQKKELEMITHPKSDDNQQYPILTHVNYYGYYSSPQGFDFDVNSHHSKITDSNLVQKANEFVNYFKKQSNSYRGKILAHTLGMDFEWSEASSFFMNIDKLINYVNSHKNDYQIEIKYGTPKEYIEAIHNQGVEYPIKTDDFFPYLDQPNGYWTGYFTSRPAFKGYIRKAGRYNQIIKKYISELLISKKEPYILANPPNEELQKFQEAVATCQHHDAVTGTAKQYVTDDYIATLYQSMEHLEQAIGKSLSEVSKLEINEGSQNIKQCSYNQTASSCEIVFDSLTNNKTILIRLLDGKTNFDGQEIIRVKVPRLENLKVINDKNETIAGEIVCANQNQTNDCDLYFIRNGNKKLIQYFKVFQTSEQASVKLIQPTPTTASNSASYKLKDNKPFYLNYGAYKAYSSGGQQSGAYIFRPDQNQHEAEAYGSIQKAILYKGDIIEMIYIQRNYTETWISAFINEKDVYHIDTYVGSIYDDDRRGKDIVLLVNTDIKNKKTFYTDSNGLELIKRVVNHRDSWNLNVQEQVSGNYYPITSMIMIKDESTNQVAALLTDRAQGATSLSEGRLEVMIHRRLFRDDAKGVQESLNELEFNDQKQRIGLRQYVSHTLVMFNIKEKANEHKRWQYLQDLKSLQYYSESDINYFKQSQNSITDTFINNIVSNDLVKIYLQPRKLDSYILRIHNMNQFPINLNLPSNLVFIETTITSNQPVKEWNKQQFIWNEDTKEQFENCKYSENEIGSQDIKTYLIEGF